MREETGLQVRVGRLLYICDHLPVNVVHLTFKVTRVCGVVGDVTAGADTRPIDEVEFVRFSERFTHLAQAGFPEAGSYMGPKTTIGLLIHAVRTG
ncbi:hypothetical protein GCM10009850_051480 [Nonomuraea monospora]|uniref:NUDIX hydrolase n=1 Tax=Nonomuraea monospora TaxID=568818 RepID=A0ABN3CJP9_9ACTN